MMTNAPEEQTVSQQISSRSAKETLERSLRGIAALAFIARMDGNTEEEDLYQQQINRLLDLWEKEG